MPDQDWGRWPRIIGEYPVAPSHVFRNWPDREWTDAEKEAQVHHEVERFCRNGFDVTGNIYYALEAYCKFHELGLYPPRWALDELYKKLKKHIANPDPQLFSWQMGISGKTSGASNPYDMYVMHRERHLACAELATLLLGFDLSQTDAARVVIEKQNLSIEPKTLLNYYRAKHGPLKALQLNFRNKAWEFQPFQSQEVRQKYLATFSRRALRLIKKKTPTKM